MKKISTFLALILFVFGLNAQLESPFTFEEGQADTAWNSFANGAGGTPDDISVMLNPWVDDVNASDSVLQFVVHDDADPWVGMYTDHCGIMEFTEQANTLSVMVYKSKISPTRLKIEKRLDDPSTANDLSITVDNSLTDEWELLKYTFPDAVGYFYQRLTFFPDFPSPRETGGTMYIDNIAVSTPDNTAVKEFSGIKMEVYPNPAEFRMAVQYPGMKGITISNVLGQTIRSLSFNTVNSKVIEVGDLRSGMYYVTAITDNGNYTMPFMKK